MQFEAAYAKFYPGLAALAGRRFYADIGEDLAQEAFIVAWKNWGKAEITNVWGWLKKILYRVWWRYLRDSGRDKRVAEIVDDYPLEDEPVHDPDILTKIDAERCLEAIRALPNNDGACVEMQALGWRQDEIGAIMGVSGERVRQRINRAMERLAKKWKRAYGPQ